MTVTRIRVSFSLIEFNHIYDAAFVAYDCKSKVLLQDLCVSSILAILMWFSCSHCQAGETRLQVNTIHDSKFPILYDKAYIDGAEMLCITDLLKSLKQCLLKWRHEPVLSMLQADQSCSPYAVTASVEA